VKRLLLLLAFVATPAIAQVAPQPGAGDPRIQSIEYNADQVVLLQAAPGYQISVEFAPDERIENVAIGDSGAWQATPNKRGDYLFVKPIQAGVSTNMTVLTDARIYAFDLRGLMGPQSDMAYTVRFRYPGAAHAGATAVNADGSEAAPGTEPQRGRYRLSGDRSIRPSGIDDDGAKTYIEWASDSALPAVYSVDAKGKESLVNGNMRDGIFVIDNVVERLVFRLDQQIARAVRVPQQTARN
jgi:type IV secretion system protein VirB9